MKRLLLMIMLICTIVVIPRVFAEEETKTIVPGVVTVITKEDTLSSGTPKTETNGNTTVITYDVATFKILGSTDASSGNRPDNKAWVGISIKKPDNATKYKVKFNGGEESSEQSLSGNSYDEYIGFDEKELEDAAKKATDLVDVLQVTWTGDNATPVTQIIKIVLVPKGITLKSKTDETEVWNNTMWEENIPKVKITLKAYKDGKEVAIPDGIISTYELKEVYALTSNQIEGARNVLMDDGIEFVGIFMDKDLKTPFVETQKFSTDTILYVAYRTGSDVPETGAFTSYLLLTVGALIAVSVLVIAQKYNRIYHV